MGCKGIRTKKINNLVNVAYKNLQTTTFYGETMESKVRVRKRMGEISFTEIRSRSNGRAMDTI